MSTIPLVDINIDGLDDFTTKYNDLTTFLNSVDIGDQFVPGLSGTAGAPAFAFTGDLDTGFFSPGAGIVALALNGGEIARWTTGGDFLLALDADFNGTLNVQGISTLQDALTVQSGGITVNDGGITVDDGGITVTIGGISITAGGLTVTAGGANITGDSTIDGELTVDSLDSLGNGTFGGSLDFTTTFAGYTRERVRNSFSRVRAYYLASL